MGTSGVFFQFMSMLEDFLPVIRRSPLNFEHESLPGFVLPARYAQAGRKPAIVFKMPPAQRPTLNDDPRRTRHPAHSPAHRPGEPTG
jgi:hypothetical protein